MKMKKLKIANQITEEFEKLVKFKNQVIKNDHSIIVTVIDKEDGFINVDVINEELKLATKIANAVIMDSVNTRIEELRANFKNL